MKTTILILLCALAGTANATLIDLTPGGFSYANEPPAVDRYFREYSLGMHVIGGANIINNQPVWSPYTLFGPEQFSITMNEEGTGAGVTWDLRDTPYHVLYLIIESPNLLAHLYAPVGRELFQGDGFVEIDGITPTTAIGFTGRVPVPDSGSTLILMSIGILGLLFISTRKQNVL